MNTDIFQTRSEDNGFQYFPTLKQALENAEKDETVWKISFSTQSGERVRLILSIDGDWVFEAL